MYHGHTTITYLHMGFITNISVFEYFRVANFVKKPNFGINSPTLPEVDFLKQRIFSVLIQKSHLKEMCMIHNHLFCYVLGLRTKLNITS